MFQDMNTKRIYYTKLNIKKIEKETYLTDQAKPQSHYEHVIVYEDLFLNCLHTGKFSDKSDVL